MAECLSFFVQDLELFYAPELQSSTFLPNPSQGYELSPKLDGIVCLIKLAFLLSASNVNRPFGMIS
jgi:hypothetical protein